MFPISFTLLIVFDLVAMTSGKLYANTHNPWWLASAVFNFALVGLFFAWVTTYKGLAITNILWAAASTIFATAAGYWYFKEAITPLQLIGVGVILIGLVLVNS